MSHFDRDSGERAENIPTALLGISINTDRHKKVSPRRMVNLAYFVRRKAALVVRRHKRDDSSIAPPRVNYTD